MNLRSLWLTVMSCARPLLVTKLPISELESVEAALMSVLSLDNSAFTLSGRGLSHLPVFKELHWVLLLICTSKSFQVGCADTTAPFT